MKNEIIRYDSKNMFINGERIILFGGEMHYFRVPHQSWEDRLSKMKNAGCNFVSLYVPWNWQEPEPGKEPDLMEENVLAILLEGSGRENAVLYEPKIEPYFEVKKHKLNIILPSE